MKKCLYCAEEIQDDAIKCKHCGEWLHKNEQQVTDKISEVKQSKKSDPQKRLLRKYGYAHNTAVIK